MTRINLLPPEIKEKAERPRLAPWYILMGVLTIAILVGLYFYFGAQKSSKEDTLQQKEQELEVLQKQTKPIEKYEAQQKELSSLEQLYQAANSGRVPWAKMLNDLAMYVPEGLATASNPRAPAIWLTSLTIDAQPLEAVAGAAAAEAGTTSATPIELDGYATPAWLCIQTWLPRASDFKAKGFLDAYPYYYYFKGHPKVAEFFVRLQNMEEWTNLWIRNSSQETIEEMRTTYEDDGTGNLVPTEVPYSDWAIQFSIQGYWNAENAIWNFTAEQSSQAGGS